MTTSIPLDAEFLQNLGIVAQDEDLLAKAVKYIKKLAAKKPDPTLMSKDEFDAMLDKAERQIARGEGKTFTNVADMNAWLNSL